MIQVSKLIAQGRGLAGALLKRAATVELDWDVRQKSRFAATDSTGRELGIFLPRGTVVRGGDVLVAEDGSLVRVIAAPQPVHYRPMFGAFGGAMAHSSISFVSQASLASGAVESLGLHKHLAAVKACRSVKKKDMVHNAYTPAMQIDAQTYEVRADGQLLTCEPATVLPMAQRYFLF